MTHKNTTPRATKDASIASTILCVGLEASHIYTSRCQFASPCMLYCILSVHVRPLQHLFVNRNNQGVRKTSMVENHCLMLLLIFNQTCAYLNYSTEILYFPYF